MRHVHMMPALYCLGLVEDGDRLTVFIEGIDLGAFLHRTSLK